MTSLLNYSAQKTTCKFFVLDATKLNRKKKQMSVRISDVFKIPLTNLKFPWGIWWGGTAILTFFPGIFLWVITLGGFRYWNLSKKYLDFCTNKQISRDHPELIPYL